jgi:polyphosphate kinase
MTYQPLQAGIPKRLREPARIFDEIREADLLLHHPYDSFDGFVAWIQAACADPNVSMIEQTVYRMDALSPTMDALKSAAAQGKKIRVIIELRARFDELNNLLLAEELRKAGAEVAFGFGTLKLHAKVVLVTRTEGDTQRLYTHLSTGNYNATTARQYTDLAILTANQEIGADARHFFDEVMNGRIPTNFKQLVSAPAKLHRRLLNLIDAETQAAKSGKRARIVAKVNALVDASVINQLYMASQAGVQVDLIVRGACSLIPGVAGLSDNIRVVSVVDRFLEHSRIYYFESSKALYLSSADWMPRNFFSRLEIAFPVLDPKLYDYISKVVIPAYLADTVKAKELTPQGTWKKRTISSLSPISELAQSLFGKKAVRSQFLFEELALREYKGTPLA